MLCTDPISGHSSQFLTPTHSGWFWDIPKDQNGFIIPPASSMLPTLPLPSCAIWLDCHLPSLLRLGFLQLKWISPVELQASQSPNRMKSCEWWRWFSALPLVLEMAVEEVNETVQFMFSPNIELTSTASSVWHFSLSSKELLFTFQAIPGSRHNFTAKL